MKAHRAVLTLVALSAAGLVPPPAPAAGAGDERVEAVEAILEQRSEAVRDGDFPAFMETIDAGAEIEFKTAQARLYEGLRSMAFEFYDYEVRTDDIPDLSAGLAERYDAEDVFLPPIEATYRIEGADLIDAVDVFLYTFLRRDGRWRIVSDRDLEDLGLPTSRNPWDFGTVEREDSDHFTVLFDPADEERAGTLLRLAEEAYELLGTGFDEPLPEQVVLVLPHDLDQLREMIQATFDLTNFVAFAATAVDRDEGWVTTAPRVFVQDVNLSASLRSFQLETLHHELIHVAAFPLAGPFVPAWIHEGVADWLAGGRGEPMAVKGSDALLPEDYEFTTGGHGSILGAYQESTSAVAFLAEERGGDAPLDLLVHAGRARVAPGTSDYHVDRALREVYGEGSEGFQRDWDGG